jgi:flagellin-like protein
MQKKKGVSPLIGAVLLIGFTMLVAGIITFWISGFTKSTTEKIGGGGETLVKCSFGGVSIYDVIWDSGSNELRVSIANIGTVDFTDVNVVVDISGQTSQTSSGSLRSADIKTVKFSGITRKPDKVIITAKDCPMISDEETRISVL